MSLFGFGKKEENKNAVQEKKSGAKVLNSSKIAGFSLKKPIVTEKALALEKSRQYVFEVSAKVSKHNIKEDVENIYGVKVESVNVMNNKRRIKFIRGKAGYSAGFKKAIIKLKEGHKIEVAPH